jgi:hypothetical protein
MPEKYVRGGNINPFWVMAEREKIMEEKALKKNNAKFYAELEKITKEYKEEVRKEVREELLQEFKEKHKQMVHEADSMPNDYDAKFQFLKSHSDTPEDLALAKSILGID